MNIYFIFLGQNNLYYRAVGAYIYKGAGDGTGCLYKLIGMGAGAGVGPKGIYREGAGSPGAGSPGAGSPGAGAGAGFREE